MTQVKFLIEKQEGDLPCNIFAFFPSLHAYDKSQPSYNEMFTCYSHVGQHSACHVDYAKECKEAKYNEYADLLRELIGQGYNDLSILNDDTIEYHRPPTKEEIKFGEGATHYRSFILNEIGVNKTGKLKKWFVALDGLRYYR